MNWKKIQVGEVALKGKTVITHYLDAQPESFDDGWLLTGDLGMLDTDNYLHIVGRRKEMIIRGGENITPLEVENCLNVLPFIKEIAVVGIPDKIYGESVTAVIVSNEEQDDNRYHLALLKHLANSQLLPVQRPTKYLFFKKLPKNATGKVQKSLLVKEIEAEELAKKEA
jgi:Acyl-CoA synthetases (AMP-forming)/AMP-acid ligases II